MTRRNYSFWVLLLFIFLAALALLFLSSYLLTGEVKEFSLAIGHAALIAAVLAATVDRYLKVHVIREIHEDSAKYLIGFGMPDEIKERIPDILRKAGVVRKDYEFRCTLSPSPTPGMILLTVTAEYFVENFTHEDQEITHKLAFECVQNPLAIELRCDTADAAASYRLTQDNLPLKHLSEHIGVVFAAAKPIRVKPRRMGFRYKFASSYSLTLAENYFEIFAFGQPTIGASITTTVLREDIQCFPSPSGITNDNRCEYPKVFMPGEHLHLRWFTNEYLRAHLPRREAPFPSNSGVKFVE